MTHISLVCPRCKTLVPVVDKEIQYHEVNGEPCETSGMRYTPSPRVFKAGPGAPSVEIVASKTIEVPCEACNSAHDVEVGLVKVDVAKVGMN